MDDWQQQLLPAVIGGVAGFLGGSVAALGRNAKAREVAVAILGGLGIGATVPPVAMIFWDIPVAATGFVGFVGGLGVFGIIAGIQKLAGRFEANPESMLPDPFQTVFRDRDGRPPPKPPGRPGG